MIFGHYAVIHGMTNTARQCTWAISYFPDELKINRFKNNVELGRVQGKCTLNLGSIGANSFNIRLIGNAAGQLCSLNRQEITLEMANRQDPNYM